MRRDLLRLFAVLGAVVVLLPAFAWVQSRVGYETFTWGGIVICMTAAVIGAAYTVFIVRKKR